MADLIDRKELRDALYEADAVTMQGVKIINQFPAVDAVEVVRCKYCIKRYDTDECPMCFLSRGQYCEFTQDDGFCDHGERKEE